MNHQFLPEGRRMDTLENRKFTSGFQGLQDAMCQGRILEGRAVRCDAAHDLFVDFGFCQGVIPHEEAAAGLADGSTREIAVLTRVGKPVCFTVTGFELDGSGMARPVLSRRAAQLRCREEYLARLAPGDVIPARVTRVEPCGAFVDLGCGVASLLPIDTISVSRIAHPGDRFAVGMDLRVVVRGRDDRDRITLTHRELLGTWQENADLFSPGETVPGVVRSVEDYGIFVELMPNLAGLAEYRSGVRPGQQATVTVKSLSPQKMKVKLILIESYDDPRPPAPPRYFFTGEHLDHWDYSPVDCTRQVGTVFAKPEGGGLPQ